MKKFFSIAALVITFSFASAAYAGGDASCHFHGNTPAKEAVVVGCATEYKNDLTKKGKLDPSWKGIKLDKAEALEGKKMKEWKLTFKNVAEKDANKQTLFMFYALNGNFIAANFTGK